jgi:hypothetical protein
MKVISGYILLADEQHRMIAFGKALTVSSFSLSDKVPCGALLGNYLMPFGTRSDAVQAVPELLDPRRTYAVRVHVAFLRLEIAQTEEELGEFEKSQRTVVIAESKFSPEHGATFDIYGDYKSIEGSAHPLPGAHLSDNGFRPFKSFGRAKRCWAEVKRQAQCQASIARMILHKVETHP